MTGTIKTIIWDLDNTLYKFTQAQIAHWHESAAKLAVGSIAGLSYDTALKMAAEGWDKHHNSWHFFVEEHGLCPKNMHVNVIRNLDEKIVTPCPQTPGLMQVAGGYRHVVLTYATRDWALRVLNHTGLSAFFEPALVIGAEDYDFETKKDSPRGILLALDQCGGNPAETLFVEDTLANLKTARDATAIRTAYLHHGRPLDGLDIGWLDYCAKDTPDLLGTHLVAGRSVKTVSQAC